MPTTALSSNPTYRRPSPRFGSLIRLRGLEILGRSDTATVADAHVDRRGPLALIAMPVALYAGVLACSRFQAQPIPKAETNQMVDAGVPGGPPRRDPAVAFAVAAAIRAGIAILGPQLEKRRLHGIHAGS